MGKFELCFGVYNFFFFIELSGKLTYLENVIFVNRTVMNDRKI